MKRGILAVASALALVWGSHALADRVSTTYAPDGGAVLPRLSARNTLSLLNANSVAICCSPSASPPGPTASCWPLLPGASLSMDVSDSISWSCRACSGSTVNSCLPDGGTVTLETQ
jgi:hypothetical protein